MGTYDDISYLSPVWLIRKTHCTVLPVFQPIDYGYYLRMGFLHRKVIHSGNIDNVDL